MQKRLTNLCCNNNYSKIKQCYKKFKYYVRITTQSPFVKARRKQNDFMTVREKCVSVQILPAKLKVSSK